MKKIVLITFASVFLTTIASAQITKGSVLLGGGIGFNRSETDNIGPNYKSNSLSVSPTIGVAVKDNWVVGANAGFYTSKTKQDASTSDYKMNGFSTGLFARRYMALSNRFYLYGETGAFYSKRKVEQVPSTDSRPYLTETGGTISIAPGITYAVSKRFHLEAYLNNLVSLNYNKTKTEYTSLGGNSRSETKNIGFQTNLNTSAPLSIGFRFVLGK